MSRIGATIHGFERSLLRQLSQYEQEINASSFRLSTGRKYNAPVDSPSAFLDVTLLETGLHKLESLHANVDAAAGIGANLQSATGQIRTQLNAIRAALVEDEDDSLTAAEKNENQAAIDAAMTTIRGLARTSLDGKRFLDGSFGYTFSGQNPNQIRRIDVFSLAGDTVLSGSVTAAATQTSRRYTGLAGAINSGDATFLLTGQRGSTTVAVTDGESLTDVRDRINLDSHRTGITASVSGDQLDLTTVDYGDAATLAVTVSAGTFNTSSMTTGTDAVVTINGSSVPSASVDGNRVTVLSQGVHVALELAAGFSGAFSSVTISDDQVARFSVSTRDSEQVKLGLASVFPELLGGVSGTLSSLESGGSLAGLGSNTSQAIRVVDEALAQLSLVEGQVDAFADVTVAAADALLTDLEADLGDALDTRNTVDEEAEELVRARYEALSENAVSALSILQQQRASMVALLRQMAGLD